MNFAPFNAHTTPLFKSCNILKFADIIKVESCIFVNIVLIGILFQFLMIIFKFQPRIHAMLDQLEMVYYLFQVDTEKVRKLMLKKYFKIVLLSKS